MTTVKAFIKRHPVLTYFALTFAISWGGILMVIGPGGILGTAEQAGVLEPSVYLAMLAGPSVAGILLTGLLTEGRAFASCYLVAQVAGGRSLVRGSAPDRPAPGDGDTLRAFANVPGIFPEIVTTDDKASLLLAGIVMGLAVASSRS